MDAHIWERTELVGSEGRCALSSREKGVRTSRSDRAAIWRVREGVKARAMEG